MWKMYSGAPWPRFQRGCPVPRVLRRDPVADGLRIDAISTRGRPRFKSLIHFPLVVAALDVVQRKAVQGPVPGPG